MCRRKGFVLAAVLIMAAAGAVYGEDCGDRDGDGDVDLDQNGIVDLGDFMVLKSNFGRYDAAATTGDCDGDRDVDLDDFAIIKRNFGQ